MQVRARQARQSNGDSAPRRREAHGGPPAQNRDEATTAVAQRLAGHRARLQDYLRHAQARQRRLLTLAVIAGAMASALTAGPALGGRPLSDRVTADLDLAVPIWQVLCAIAALCALSAAIATQLLKSQNLDEHVARAQTALARLEVIDLAMAIGQLTLEQALAEYSSCVELTPFL